MMDRALVRAQVIDMLNDNIDLITDAVIGNAKVNNEDDDLPLYRIPEGRENALLGHLFVERSNGEVYETVGLIYCVANSGYNDVYRVGNCGKYAVHSSSRLDSLILDNSKVEHIIDFVVLSRKRYVK